MVIQNAARGAAHDLTLSVVPDIPIWVRRTKEGEIPNDDYRLTNLAVFQRGIRFLGPGQAIRFMFGSYLDLTHQPISVTVTIMMRRPAVLDMPALIRLTLMSRSSRTWAG